MRKLALVILSLCVCFYAYTQNLSSAKVETSGNTSSSTFTAISGSSNLTLNVTDVNKVLVVGTLTSKTLSGNSTGSYRICDISDPENINSGSFELTHTSKDGIGTIVYVFDVSAYSGDRTWSFQHCTSAGEITTSCSFTAIALYDGVDNLAAAVSSLNSPLELNENLVTVCSVTGLNLVANPQDKGGVYIAASIQNQKTDGGTTTSATGQWVLQYKLSSESVWTNLNYLITRSPLGEQKGMVSLVAALPDNISNGNYDFRVAHQKTAGTATFVTQKCNIVAVSLRSDEGYFPIFSSSKQYANTTSSSLSAVLDNVIIPQSNTDIFVHAQYAVQANGLTQSTKHDISLSKSGNSIYDGTDFNKYLHNSSHKCSGSVSALIEDLELDSTYSLSFRHASASGRNLNTSETFLVCFGLDRSSQSFVSPVTVNSTEGLKSSSYNTIKSAFDDINSGLFKGKITIMINDNCNETASCVLNASGTGSCFYSSILIYPTKPNITVSANLASQLIDFNGSDSVVIDGRVNLIGDASLTISNSSTNASARTIRFYNSSENNTIKYCNINGSTPATTAGVVYFYTSSSGSGNRNISIENCKFTNAGTRPYNIIYSNGTAGRPNSHITISDCEFYNHLSSEGSSSAIKLAYYSNNWNIDSNQFYDSEIIEPTGNFMYCPINITSTDANIYNITNNYIGGSEPLCSGDAFKIRSSKPHYFRAIYIRNSGTDLTTISGNHIENIDYLTTNSNPWDGIQIFSGKVLISSNFIGNSTSYGSVKVETPNASFIPQISGGVLTSITVVNGGSGYDNPIITITSGGGSGATANATVVDGVITSVSVTNGGSGYTSIPNVNVDANYTERATTHGIRLLTSDEVTILGNIIGSFQLVGNDGYAACFEGIYVDEGRNGTKTISNNIFGSETVENSIHCSSLSTNALVGPRIYGVYYQGAAYVNISGNIFSNFTNSYNGLKSTSLTTGIYVNRGNADIEDNVIHDIKTSTANSGGASSASAFGIGVAYNSAGKIFNVRNNEIYNVFNTHPNARVDIYGIYFSASNSDFHEVSGNYVHDIGLSTSDINSSMDGIVLYVGKVNCFNNIVHLGKDYVNKHLIFGIWDQSSWGCDVNLYYNTVLIEGSVASEQIRNSYAFYNRAHSGAPLRIKNNIFVNTRTGGLSGKHYAIRVWGNSNLEIDYNNYYTVSAAIGLYNNTDKTDLSLWEAATLGDANSYSTDPEFAFSGTGYEQYYPTIKQNADNSTGILFDFIGQERSLSNPKIGALENEDFVWTGSVNTDFATAANWESSTVPEAGANIIFSLTASNHCVLDSDREVGNITNASDKNLILNSKKLKIKGSTAISSSGKINAESIGDIVEYAGLSQQKLIATAFSNATINKLFVSNSNNLILIGDIEIRDSLKLYQGEIDIDTNRLVLNGIISYSGGSILGGNSSEIIVQGSAQQLNLDSITLGKLQLNRTNGIKLLGDLTIQNELLLSNGTIDLNEKSIQLNCSQLSGPGSIYAEDSISSIIFNNSAALVLPSTLFADTVSNIRLLNNGITLQNNLVISHNLLLYSSNPSSTKGLLDLGAYTLTMCENATTIGQGDLTGIVKRTSFSPYKEYTFGNQFTHIVFLPGGTYPDSIKCKISIGSAPSWKSNAIYRVYDFIQSNGANCFATISSHYQESELNGINEYDLSQWTYGANGQMPAGEYDWGTSNQDFVNNRIEIANVNIGYFPTVFGNLENTLASTSLSYSIWDGSESSDWSTAANWNSNSVPDATSYVLIPSSYNTLNDPLLPLNAEIRSLRIDPDGILNSNTNSTLTVNGNVGAWACYNGTFNPSTGTVVFTNDNASISGSTSFYNLTIGDDANDTLWMSSGSVIRIAGIVSNNGVWRTVISGETTVEYNGGNQTVVVPNSATKRYSTLVLSGTGTKTMPIENLNIIKEFRVTGETSATAMSSLSIDGDFTICCNASFSSGNFDHLIKGNIVVNGNFAAFSGYNISLIGDSAQSISGDSPISFSELTINNLRNVYLYDNITVNSNLDLINGELVIGENTLSINGNISRTNGKICSCDYCSISFGGTSSLTLDNELFCEIPEFRNFYLDRSGGVKLGNQGLIVKNELSLNDGTLDINSKTLTIYGNIVKTNGKILSEDTGTLCFEQNTEPLTLPNGLFETGSIFSKITVNRAGDIYLANQDLVIKDTLVLSDGILFTGSTAKVHFMETAIAENSESLTKGESQYSFIDGSVEKTGNTSFVFPVGNLDEYAPLSISDADGGGNAADYFSVRYVKDNPSSSGYSINLHEASINHVSSSEYWLVDRTGTNNVNLSLSWDERSGGVNEVNDLVVAHWNGTQWADMGNAGTTGDTTNGTIISNLCTSFSPFTIASKSNKNTLPVTIVSYAASCNHGIVSVYWEVLAEYNIAFYTVEKSCDGIEWIPISKINSRNSNSSSSYMIVDDDITGKGAYYRLAYTDNDEQSTIYKKVWCDACNNESVKPTFTISPNPASDFISITSSISEESFLLELFDCNGKIIRKEICTLNKKINVKDLDTGSYYYIINKNETGKVLIIR